MENKSPELEEILRSKLKNFEKKKLEDIFRFILEKFVEYKNKSQKDPTGLSLFRATYIYSQYIFLLLKYSGITAEEIKIKMKKEKRDFTDILLNEVTKDIENFRNFMIEFVLYNIKEKIINYKEVINFNKKIEIKSNKNNKENPYYPFPSKYKTHIEHLLKKVGNNSFFIRGLYLLYLFRESEGKNLYDDLIELEKLNGAKIIKYIKNILHNIPLNKKKKIGTKYFKNRRNLENLINKL